jgi:hypothetical protein
LGQLSHHLPTVDQRTPGGKQRMKAHSPSKPVAGARINRDSA